MSNFDLDSEKGHSLIKSLTPILKLRQGKGAMGMNAMDIYNFPDRVCIHRWAMGGESYQFWYKDGKSDLAMERK